MGGPLSPLTWEVAFDPVMWIAQLAACCKALGYVDDLLSNIFGPGQLLLVYLILLAAAQAAGRGPVRGGDGERRRRLPTVRGAKYLRRLHEKC